MKTLLLIDSHALIHRAYHALPPFTSKKGEPTGALYGFSTMMLRAINDFKPDYIAAAFDLPGKTFRHEVYEEYKAKRPEVEDNLIKQLKKLPELVESFGIYSLSAPGFEADDVLGTIVEQVQRQDGGGKDLKIIIVSGDMDILQLVEDEKIVVYTMKRGINDTVTYDEKKVLERYGFVPKLLPDFKGLRGDPSDNIVGVRGIGEKTATDLIKKFGTLENLYKKMGAQKNKPTTDIKERTVQLLLDHKEDAFFSKTLATIRKDAPIKFELKKAEFELNKEKLKEMFLELGFNSLFKRVSEGEIYQPPLNPLLARGGREEAMSLFPETNDKLSFVLVRDGKIYGNPDFKEKIVSNDIKNLIKISGKIPKDFFDLAVANWASDSEKKSLDLPTDPKEALTALPALYKNLIYKIKERGVESVVYEIEFPLVPILAEMETNGVGLDKGFLNKFKKEISQKVASIEEKIYKAAGTNFNINSPAQVGEVFLKLGIAGRARTATGKISTKESELLKLKEKHPIVSLILEHRELSKLFSTYIVPLLELAKNQGRAHTTFNQTGTVTGRLSSDSPNLQNIPIRSEVGAKIREAFVASPGFTFLSFDYSQIELKILAVLSEDKKMIDAFKKGLDIHAMVASEINNLPPDKVNAQMRSRAKTINFGIVFGMGVRKLAQNTGMNTEQAQKFYDEYFHDFPKVKSYIEKIKKEAKNNGFVSTYFGRKRFFDMEKIKYDRFLQSEMERMAFNAVIQGTDADIVKKAMINIQENFDAKKIKPILQIHDELLYEVRDDILKLTALKMKKIMESVVSFPIPLGVEMKIGKRWGILKKLKIKN
ncbi:MAG: DNA polymerase [Patescibacteria group bacterium]